MKVLKLSKLMKSERIKEEIAKAIVSGEIFIYPTDTLYGLGCNPENTESVKKIILAKSRPKDKPFSVIAPSKEWVFEHTRITKENKKFVESLFPGPYTVILKAKRGLPKSVVSKEGTIAVRMPRNDFCDFIRKQNVLFITTSLNITEEEPIKRIGDIPKQIKDIVDYAIDSGPIEGKSSRIFNITTNDLEIARF